MLVVGVPSAEAFGIGSASCSPLIHHHHVHQRTSCCRRSSALFSSPPKPKSSSAEKRPNKRRNRAPRNIKPNSRYVAISALAEASAGAQVNAGTFATRQLEQDQNYKSLEVRDRAFSRLLVATVERRLGQIDAVLKCVVQKYPPKKGKHSHAIQATLRTGVAQLLFLQTPPHAAIKETVQVLRMIPNIPEPMVKFVNGVLRNLSRPPSDASSEEGTPESLGMVLLREKTSPQDNIAPWLLKRWKRDWGDENTKLMCEEMMPYDESSMTSRIDVTSRYSLGVVTGVDEDREQLENIMTKLGDDSTPLPQGSIRVGSSLKGGVESWPEYEEGTWWVQDASSTLPALALTSALLKKYTRDEFDNLNVVDMCSAPGGKTSQLLSAGFGLVTAIEASPRRSRRLIENLTRLGFNEQCEVVVEQGQNWTPTEAGPVHGILVDVPCSATGTGARRPDVLRRGSDLSELLEIQEILANHCADNVLDAGGIMVYATCSILKEESEGQVQKLLERGGMETLPIQGHEVPGFEDAIDNNGWLRVLPGILEGELSSTDGFFVARLVKQ